MFFLPPAPALADDEVHVWHAPLEILASDLPHLRSLLSVDEQRRADRFVTDLPRLEFCLARGVLRLLLESYGIAPAAEVAFAYSPHWKPSLAPRHAADWLQFNISHTRGLAAYAFARSRPVGVDVETVRELNDADEIVMSHFAPEEILAYQAFPAAVRPRAFFAGWTRKEAFVKASGSGFSRAPNSFAVTLNPDAQGRLLHIDADTAAAAEWTLADWTVPPSYQVAVVVRSSTPMRFVRIDLPRG